jgi:diguanylate cyclase (GGDEF)-like protein
MAISVHTQTRLTGATILLVSTDGADCLRFVAEMADAGLQAATASTPTDALALLEQRALGVLIVQLRLPNLDGMWLIDKAKELAPEVASVALVDLPLNGVPGHALLDPRVLTVVGKPWQRADMRDTVQKALANHHERLQAQRDAAGDIRVLLVEDDLSDANAVVRGLSSLGGHKRYAIQHVETLADGLDVLREHTFDVILSDLSLPDSDGLDSALRLQRCAPDTALVVLSSRASDDLALRAVEQGAQDFLMKGQAQGHDIARAIQLARARKTSEHRLKTLAHVDPLTGLANRRTLHKRLALALARCRRSGSGLAVLSMDLDRFKEINNTYGHAIGDALLAEVGRRIRTTFREYDTPARLGGDAFVILLDLIEDPQVAKHLADRLLDTLDQEVRLGEVSFDVSASIGVATYPTHGNTLDALLNAANQALYTAKVGGRNAVRVSCAVAEQDKDGMLQADLRLALERDEFLLYYQPLVDAQSTETVAFEALIRWNRNGEIIAPYIFIPMLERSGQIVEVGQWVLETAATQLKEWRDAGQPSVRMAVNLSARQFERDRLIPTVTRVLRDNDLPADALELEITESLLMRDTDRTSALLVELRNIGVRISIDDFGTGYSSLAYLQRFPVDTLKIDRSFVSAVSNSKDDAAITSAIIGLGTTLGLEIVAEGVEGPEQADFLRAAGCTTLQGYYYGRPDPRPKRAKSPPAMAPVG